jgi:hypothetical protein
VNLGEALVVMLQVEYSMVGEEHLLSCQRLQDRRLLVVCVADTQVEHFIESSRTQEGLIEKIRTVGRADDENASASIFTVAHAVQFCQ